jgi:hypothetical protein
MSKLLFFAALVGANAFAGYTADMTCAQVQAKVGARGFSLLSTSPGHADRYVSSGDLCSLGESAYGAWVPTRDIAHCDVGYTCGPENTSESGN